MYFAALLIALVSSPVVVSYNEFISYVYAAYFSLIRCKDKTSQLQVSIELCVLYTSTCGTTAYVHDSMLYVLVDVSVLSLYFMLKLIISKN